MEISELVRLFRSGESDHRIQATSAYNRRTVAKHRQRAKAQGLLEGKTVESGRLHELLTRTLPAPLPPQQHSTVERYREQIVALRARGMEIAAGWRKRCMDTSGVILNMACPYT